MKTATLTLYYKSLLNKDKNFILDNPNNGKSAVENYLSTLENDVITGFQYQKHQMVLTLKIDRNQTALNMGQNAQDLNYIKIQNEGENPKYYFIIGKNWKAENTIELVCNMDTLNSFEFNRDYEVNKKTLVKREHRDRFEKFPTITFDWEFKNGVTHNPNPVFHTDLNLSQADDIEVLSYQMIYEDNPGQTEIVGVEPYEQGGVKGLLCQSNTISYNKIILRVTYRIKAFTRLIDLKSEEINTPVYKYDEDIVLEQKGESNVSWSLFYRNRSDQENAPVDCFLLPDTAIDAVYQVSDQQIDHNSIPSNGDFIILYSQDYSGFNVDVNGSNYPIRKSTGWSYGTYYNWTLLALRLSGTNVEVWQAKMEIKSLFFPPVPQFTGSWTKIWTGSYVKVDFIADSMTTRRVASLPSSQAWCVGAQSGQLVGSAYTINFGTTASAPVITKTEIDKTDSKNIKIIDVPYCPSSFYIDGSGAYVFPTPWKMDAVESLLKLRDLNTRFINEITSGSRNVLIDFVQNVPNGDLTTMKRFFKDSKLYHSDYYRTKFVYDSFSKTFALEKIDFTPNGETSNYLQFNFVMSRNIVSKFLFQFDYKYKVANEDYENIVAVARNNEEVLYNSQYLNYVRTGYNYDLKAKERQDTSSAVGIGLSALGVVASIAIAVATENPLPVAGALASGIGLVGSMTNYAKTSAQNEENIQRKLQEAQQQAVSVMNADDSDLLFAYSGNKAKICYYKASERMMSVLDDLFYYGGYITNEQKIPNVRTRYWFNFVQCSLIIEESNNLTEDIENDIKSKFENGVTFMHLRNGQFDLRQEKENMETSIVGG